MTWSLPAKVRGQKACDLEDADDNSGRRLGHTLYIPMETASRFGGLLCFFVCESGNFCMEIIVIFK